MSFSMRFGNDFIRREASSRVTFSLFGRSILFSLTCFARFLMSVKRRRKFSATLHSIEFLDQKSFARANADSSFCLHPHANQVVTPVAFVGSRVITEDILLRQVGGNLRKSSIQIFYGFWNVNSAAGLCREFFHPSLGGEVAHVGVVVETSLHDIDLALVTQQSSQSGVEIMIVATGGVATIGDDDNHAPAAERFEVTKGVENAVIQRGRAFRFSESTEPDLPEEEVTYRTAPGACLSCKTPLQRMGTRLACPSCRSCLVAMSDLETALRAMTEQPDSPPAPAITPLTGGFAGPTRACPQCATPMTPCLFATIPIDRCSAHGIWFDHDELERTLHAAAPQKSPDGVTPVEAAGGALEAAGDVLEILGIFAF